MARRGGARPGAGRKKGVVGQAKRELAAMARDHAEAALLTLVSVAGRGESEAARVSAANAILDRAYGRPVQGMTIAGPDGGPIRHQHATKELSDDDLLRIASGRGARAAAQDSGAK